MQLTADELAAATDDHIYFSKEASSGGGGGAADAAGMEIDPGGEDVKYWCRRQRAEAAKTI